MKIAFLTRVDAFNKYGGDTYQLEMYVKYLNTKNHKGVIYNDMNIPDDFDCYIIANLDRPLELVEYYRKLALKGLENKTFILSIHHDFSYIEYYEKNVREGLLYTPFKLLSNNLKREKLKNIIRGIKDKKLLFPAIRQFFINYPLAIKKIINNSAALITIAEKERESIEKDFSVSLHDFFIVHNGVDLAEIGNYPWNKRDIDVLVAGRIEPRKNALAIAKSLANLNCNVSFVGALNQNSKKYCEQFQKVIDETDNLKYLGKVNSREMVELYSRSKVSLSASWFEVASLVDLEAYAYGCHVISSSNGYTNSYLGQRVNYLNPTEIENAFSLISSLLLKETDNLEQYKFISESFTWNKAAEHLIFGLKTIFEIDKRG
ncbi:hypothetical protein BIY29_06160 [Brenneria alni]|uniref:Glycosyl transferase family 1 domain-containing protein n=1 Tax=Brenneria alni TaxID=71656 RepID=A0A421DQW5_9GAMM|nr:glycosyltransferase family 4 protein [Brenneria alni]RLM26398.1 hypothetical protein BIY29_06160 [Brenneria alni]